MHLSKQEKSNPSLWFWLEWIICTEGWTRKYHTAKTEVHTPSTKAIPESNFYPGCGDPPPHSGPWQEKARFIITASKDTTPYDNLWQLRTHIWDIYLAKFSQEEIHTHMNAWKIGQNFNQFYNEFSDCLKNVMQTRDKFLWLKRA